MEPSSQRALIWLIVGVGLIAAEWFLPGFISVFLGMSGVIVSGLIWAGVVESSAVELMVWVAVSIFLVLTLRSTLVKFFPGERSVGSLDDDAQAKGTVVEVVKDVEPMHSEGQVNFRDAVWSARSLAAPIKKGEKARLVRRENIVWLVEPVA